MRRSFAVSLVAAAAIVALAGIAIAQDAEGVVKNRQDTMKAQGKDMGAVKAFIDGKGGLAAAQAGGADLVARVGKIPDLFPKGSGMAELPGKSWAKPVVWSDWNKFIAQAEAAYVKASALNDALKTGDKPKIQAAFGDMGKNGCGGCHEPFREKKPS